MINDKFTDKDGTVYNVYNILNSYREYFNLNDRVSFAFNDDIDIELEYTKDYIELSTIDYVRMNYTAIRFDGKCLVYYLVEEGYKYVECTEETEKTVCNKEGYSDCMIGLIGVLLKAIREYNGELLH